MILVSHKLRCRMLCLALGVLAILNLAAQDVDADRRDSSLAVLVETSGQVQVIASGSEIWVPARRFQILKAGDALRTGENSRAAVRFSDRSVIRVNQRTTFQVLPPRSTRGKNGLNLREGKVYFFSREKPDTLHFQTPLMTGAIRGTEFHLDVEENGTSEVSLMDGTVAIEAGSESVVLSSGEQVVAQRGKPLTRSALINANNIIQWCLYYPGIVHVADLGLTDGEAVRLRDSLAAYQSGDLPAALEAFPGDAAGRSDGVRLYEAGLWLSVGRIGDLQRQLEGVNSRPSVVRALDLLVAAVKNQEREISMTPESATEWLARSYYQQSRSSLEEALFSARQAVALAPDFGLAWVRVAELEFGSGHRTAAGTTLDRALEIGPRNARAQVLRGFVFSAENRFHEAIAAFDQAMELDGSLADAWLGRGLCRFRLNQRSEALADLQVAATLEPQRSNLRSYLGKAFDEAGEKALAEKEYRLAKQLDPGDPTPWLYAALQQQRNNEVNDAVRSLEQSKTLNDNRSVYRSRLLLDQDQAVRSANLASIYRDAGLFEVGLREGYRAVALDYANASSHLFLADSYRALEDGKRFNLRYETVRVSELLMANLLAPVGAGNLSQSVTQNEFSHLFTANRPGIASQTDYSSNGDWDQSTTVHGLYGPMAFAVDTHYGTQNGYRPNNDIEELEISAQFKYQLTPADGLYLQAAYLDRETGDVAQYYDQSSASQTLRVQESQEPNLFLGYHREWSPNFHTLILAGRLQDTLEIDDPAAQLLFFRQENGETTGVSNPPGFALDYENDFEAYSGEIQQLWQDEVQTVMVGGRYQTGWNDTRSNLDRQLTGRVTGQSLETDLTRANVYAYYQRQVLEPLRLTVGLSYDYLDFPSNIDTSPVSDHQEQRSRLSPKAALVYTPRSGTTLRAAYSQSLGGLFYDNSVRLEPTQLGGFNQAFRSLIPESAAGIVPGAKFETTGLALDQRFDTGTYLTLQGEVLNSEGDRDVGVLSNSTFLPTPDTASTSRQQLDFQEMSLTASVHQLLSRDWVLGAAYRIGHAALDSRFHNLPDDAPGAAPLNQDVSALMQQLDLSVRYHHRCGFFGEFNSLWTHQANQDYAPSLVGEDFWHHNVFAGYRFSRRRAEIAVGVANLTDQDYRLNPLNLHAELPRERTLLMRFRFYF